jgi:hypothetical protein
VFGHFRLPGSFGEFPPGAGILKTKKPPDAAAVLGLICQSKILRSRRYVGDVIKIDEGCAQIDHGILDARALRQCQGGNKSERLGSWRDFGTDGRKSLFSDDQVAMFKNSMAARMRIRVYRCSAQYFLPQSVWPCFLLQHLQRLPVTIGSDGQTPFEPVWRSCGFQLF